MDINIKDFLEKFNQKYELLYDNNDQVAGYNKAVNTFDDFCKINSNFVSEFVKFRGDYISSDREAAAFMFAFVDSTVKQNLHTFFVLDLDGTYNNEPEDAFGVEPSVYLIPLEKQNEIKKLAIKAHDIFHSNFYITSAIGDIFEDLLKANGIKYQYIGQIKIPFGERKVNYLVDYLPQVII